MSKKDELNLKGPDVFQIKAAQSVEYLKANSTLVVAVVGIVLFSAIGAIGYDYYSKSQVEKRQLALSEVDQLFANEAKTFEDKKAEIEKELDSLKLKNKEKATPELKASIDSLQKKLDGMTSPDHSGSMVAYKKVSEDFSGSPQGMVAAIQYASLLFGDGKLAEAKSVLLGFTKNSAKYPVIRAQSGMLLIGVLEDLGEFDQALSEAESLSKDVGKELQARVLLSMGRIHYLKRDLDSARKVFDELIESHKNSQESEKARSLKALLN